MSNIDYGIDTIITKRRRPNKTTTYIKIAYRAFSNLAIKKLLWLTLTYYYNMNMNKVNREDQIKASYPV